MEEENRKKINAKVVDIICSSLTALKENENIGRPNYSYLLNQAIRQYVPADANKHISEATLYVWERLLGLDKNDIKNNYYDEIITRAPQACDVHIPTYQGNNKTVYESFAVQDKFNFNKIFIVEHTTPVADIIDALRKLDEPDEPINSNNVQEILEKIHTTTMLKIEDRRIQKSSGRIQAEDIKKNRSNDIFNQLVNSFYSNNNLKDLHIKFDDPNLEKLYNNGIQIIT